MKTKKDSKRAGSPSTGGINSAPLPSIVDRITRTAAGAPDWPPISKWPEGRPIAQWPRLDAGRSDDLRPKNDN